MNYYIIVLVVLIISVCIIQPQLNRANFPTITLKYWLIISIIFISLFYRLKQYRIYLLLFLLNNTIFRAVSVCVLLIFSWIFRSHGLLRIISRLVFSQTIKSHNSPCIYICNYPGDVLEYSLVGLLPEKTAFVMIESLANLVYPIFGKDRLIVANSKKKGNFDDLHKEITDRISRGYSIFAYPEKSYYQRPNPFAMTPFRSGLFTIAKNLNVPVIPIVCSHLNFFCGIEEKKCYIRVFDPVRITDVERDKQEIYTKMSRQLSVYKYSFVA